VIFFNNVGYLGMCGHGTIGVMATLAFLGRITPGKHRIETPVGVVCAELRSDGRVTVENVASYRHRKGVSVEVPGFGRAMGDVAWGGNWFFLTENAPAPLTLENRETLTSFAVAVKAALDASAITGANEKAIDHIELFAASPEPGIDSRNFVLCPGNAYDRSPCGTGTSAKLACLAADGKLAPGQLWRQEGILGTVFEGSYRVPEGEQRGCCCRRMIRSAQAFRRRCWLRHESILGRGGCWRGNCWRGVRARMRQPRAEDRGRRERSGWRWSDGGRDGPHRGDGRFAGAACADSLFAESVGRAGGADAGRCGI
jgi:hypothetical protein